MKSLDELKGPRKRKKKHATKGKTKPTTTTHKFSQSRTGVPVMPSKGHDDAYTLDSLYDTFNL